IAESILEDRALELLRQRCPRVQRLQKRHGRYKTSRPRRRGWKRGCALPSSLGVQTAGAMPWENDVPEKGFTKAIGVGLRGRNDWVVSMGRRNTQLRTHIH